MAKYHVLIDRDVCVADGLCSDKAPDVFELDDEGKPIFKNPDTKWPENLIWIARNCPVEAVTIIDAETGERVWPPE
jgi:ferredoxin